MKLATPIFFFGLVAAMGASVDLTWNPSASADIASYNVYYGASHSYQNQVQVGTNLTAHIDGLQAGVTYYFAVTAVDVFGVESDYSNEFADTIPTPTTNTLVTVLVPVLSSTNLNGPWVPEQSFSICVTNPPGQKFYRFGLGVAITNQSSTNN